jgi:hypothetical protein
VPDFTSADLKGSRFTDVNLSDARFRLVDLTDVLMRGVYARYLELSGEIIDLRVNGVEVMPLVEAELDRRYPERVKMRPSSADGFREAWDILERLWSGTVARARRLAPEALHRSVEDEWSFLETLRHLAFATDAWVGRALLGDPSPWDPLDLPFDEMPAAPGVPWDRDARPSLDEVLALRADRQATVRRVLAELTDERLDEMTDPVDGPGWPLSQSFPVRECLTVVLSEEWEHRQYAERDLDVLTAPPS